MFDMELFKKFKLQILKNKNSNATNEDMILKLIQ
jgi:hypothetical protein